MLITVKSSELPTLSRVPCSSNVGPHIHHLSFAESQLDVEIVITLFILGTASGRETVMVCLPCLPLPCLRHNHQWGWWLLHPAYSGLWWNTWQHGSQGLSESVNQMSCCYVNTSESSYFINGGHSRALMHVSRLHTRIFSG